MATVGSDPILMLTGPTPASEKALRAAGMTARDVDLWEINEAFAAVVLQTTRNLGIDPDRVNVNGGASPWVTRSGRPVRCSSGPQSTSWSAPASEPPWSPCASAEVRASLQSSSAFDGARGPRGGNRPVCPICP